MLGKICDMTAACRILGVTVFCLCTEVSLIILGNMRNMTAVCRILGETVFC